MVNASDTIGLPATLPRVIALQGASNLRDLGGYPSEGGGHTRFGRVYRSAALATLTDADQATIAALGLRTVCDFRGTEERRRAVSRLPAGIEQYSLPIEPSIGASLRDIAATRAATGEDALSLMRRAYVAYALEWSARYHAMFDLLLQEDRLPLLLHCSAGKDRTGFGSALLLTALGVKWEVVMADYLATNRLWRGDSELAQALPQDVGEVMLRVYPDLLEVAFGALRREYGSIDRYFERALGLAPPARARLQAMLVET